MILNQTELAQNPTILPHWCPIIHCGLSLVFYSGSNQNHVLSSADAVKLLQLCPTLCDPHRRQPTRFSRQEHWSRLPFPSPMLESETWKWSRSVMSNLRDPIDCSLPGFSVHGIFQAIVLEWVAIAFSGSFFYRGTNPLPRALASQKCCTSPFLSIQS